MTSNQENDTTETHIALSAGTAVSHYKIISKIGVGGMGEVYLAEDTALNRNVALKFLPLHLTGDPDFKARFKREAQSAAKLNHPNIITVYEVGEHIGRPYFVMEHVEGRTLKEIASSEKLDTDKIVSLAIQICDGLGAAHDKGVVHRDIKPSNIVIDAYGRPKILDFGLATIQGGEQLTKTGSTLGTVRYMSPEQVEGKALDNRSDLFSLGVVFYELLTGQSPFGRESDIATVKAISTVTPEPLARFSSGVSDDVQRIVSKLLEKDPSLRYQTASGLLSDLKRLMSSAQTADTVQPAKQRSKWIPVAIISVIIVVAAVVQIYFWPSESVDEPGAKKMLAVLPFENLGAEEDEYFADGITEEITARLASVGDLGIIARTSVMKYKGTTKSISEIGAELGVDYVLEGTVRWQKSPSGVDRVRVTPQLINVSDGTHEWANIYDEVMEEVFTVQTDIATGITEALGIALGIEEKKALVERHTESIEAYDFYLRGNDYWFQASGGNDETPIRVANKLYRQSLNADPTYVPALARLAQTEIELYWHNSFDSIDLNEAWRYIQQALAINSTSMEARIALGSYYYHDNEYDKALAEFFRVLERQPNNSDVLMEIAYVYQRQGNFEEALESHRLAAEFDPLRAIHIESVAYCLSMLRKFDEAEQTYYEAIALSPDMPTTYGELSWLIVNRDGDLKRARKIISDAEQIVTPNYHFYFKGFIEAAWDGDFRSALRYSDLLRAFDGDEEYHLRMAYIYRMQNKRELERAQADSAYAILKKGAGQIARAGFYNEMLGIALVSLGRFEEAIEHGKKGVDLEIIRSDLNDRRLTLAWIYLESGDEDASLDILEKILSMLSLTTTKSIQLDPQFKPLHDHPRFKALMKKYEI